MGFSEKAADLVHLSSKNCPKELLLLLQNWIAGPSFLVASIPLYVARIPREEEMMLDQFGEEYRRYAERTGRVVPRWRG